MLLAETAVVIGALLRRGAHGLYQEAGRVHERICSASA